MLFSRDNGMQIDLHWHLGPQPFASWFDPRAVRARAVTVEIARREVPTLSPRDLLRFLCVHAAKHGWISLRDVSDIARLMRFEVDYAAMLADAEVQGGLRVLLLGLALARDLAGAELPAMVSERVDSDRGLPALVAAAKENLVHGAELQSSGMLRWHWMMLNRPVDRVRLLWGFLLPNTLDRAGPALRRLLRGQRVPLGCKVRGSGRSRFAIHFQEMTDCEVARGWTRHSPFPLGSLDPLPNTM